MKNKIGVSLIAKNVFSFISLKVIKMFYGIIYTLFVLYKFQRIATYFKKIDLDVSWFALYLTGYGVSCSELHSISSAPQYIMTFYRK